MKSVIVDFRISEKSEARLIELGYTVIKTQASANLQKPVCGHPDMMMCRLSDAVIVAETTFCGFLTTQLKDISIIEGSSKLKPAYPYDIPYNSARVGNHLFCYEKYTDAKILEYSRQNGIKIINVKQGYAKCSICVVSDNAIITSDKNIFNAATENNIDVLLTENKEIKLEGFSEGFIGGATGLIEKDLLAVNGNIELHRDCERIKSFCSKYRVNIISLANEPITDIGTIIRL